MENRELLEFVEELARGGGRILRKLSLIHI